MKAVMKDGKRKGVVVTSHTVWSGMKKYFSTPLNTDKKRQNLLRELHNNEHLLDDLGFDKLGIPRQWSTFPAIPPKSAGASMKELHKSKHDHHPVRRISHIFY